MRIFTMIIEKDKQGLFFGSIIELPGLQSRGKSLDELHKNIRDAIIVYAAFHRDYEVKEMEFIGLQRIRVPLKELDEAINSAEEYIL